MGTPGMLPLLIVLIVLTVLGGTGGALLGASARNRGVPSGREMAHTAVIRPSGHATVSGTVLLDARATGTVPVEIFQGYVPIRHVEFVVITRGHPTVRLPASSTIVGWLADWNTTGVRDGNYSLVSLATTRHGATATSAPVTITVKNA